MLLKKAVIKTTMNSVSAMDVGQDQESDGASRNSVAPTTLVFFLQDAASQRMQDIHLFVQAFSLAAIVACHPLKDTSKDRTLEFVTPRPQPGPMPRSLLRCPGRLQTEPRQPRVCKCEHGPGFAFDTSVGSSEDDRKYLFWQFESV